MSSGVIYRINNKGYLLHANRKAFSGFSIASEPFIRILEPHADINILVGAIKKVLNANDGAKVPDPKNWSEFSKEFFKRLA